MSLNERLGVALIVGGAAVLLAQRALSALRQRAAAPQQVHAVLPPSATAYKRVIVIGDVHGCPEELQALLDKLSYRKGVDVLLSVGDLVNKGPDSAGVLKLALQAGMQCVRGNHDDSAYNAFRCWLEGRDIPKPAKHAWVAGLEEQLAAFLGGLPYSLQLPSYGVVLVHAGLVPGVPLQQQGTADMMLMRDVVPAREAAAADAATAALTQGAPVEALPASSFDWGAAEAALERLTVEAVASGSGVAGGDAGGEPDAAAGSRLPPDLRLEGREVPNPLGQGWAGVWRGPHHVLFGHDAKRRLQLCPAATGLDTGCVYGGQLTAAVLPPLDELGRPLPQCLSLPPDAREFRLRSGLPAFLVQVQARAVHSDKFLKKAQQEQDSRQDAAKQRTQAALAGRAGRDAGNSSGSAQPPAAAAGLAEKKAA